MHKVRATNIHARNTRSFEHTQRLQHRGALAPHPDFPNRPVFVLDRQRRFITGLPPRHVVCRQHTFATFACTVHDAGVLHVGVNRFGNKAFVNGATRCFNLGFAPLCSFGLGQDAVVGVSQHWIAKQAFWGGCDAAGQPCRIRRRPLIVEKV